ncbi:glycosyltransferase family 4 protein [Thermococcus sp.]|uniref:glycosyltransferase family 4 protein n=1 Tax=Thermococcus sp. TaxID=35749 RepID=UPI002613D229|nr:glycosyltransferase family 4 protein [Thermococcus sp.]
MVEFKDKTILVLTNSYPDRDGRHYGGIFVKEQVDRLREYFGEVYVISPQPFGTNKILQDYQYENVRVFFPRFFHLPVGYFRKRLGNNFFKAALKVIKKEGLEFDIIHAHFTWPSGYAGALLKKSLGKPLVVTGHGYDVYDLPFRDKTWFRGVKFALDSADHVITVSNRNREILVEKLGVPVGKVSVIPNGFDSNLFKPLDKAKAKRKLGLPLDKKIVLNVANLVPVKGHEFLVRAMVDVLKVRRDILLVVVGDGPLRGKLEGLVKKLGLSEYVKFVGARPHDEIPLWMNAADLFVLPSLREGNPTVMFEALGVGLPFVGTSVGGVPEVIKSEDYGLLCPPADAKCLAEKILSGLTKVWDTRKIVRYATQYCWLNILDTILRLYLLHW